MVEKHNQHRQAQADVSEYRAVFELLAVFYGNSYGYGIIYVNTWEYVGRCVCQIKHRRQIRENVLPWEYRRAQVLAVRVQIGDHEERRHSDSQVDNQTDNILCGSCCRGRNKGQTMQ